MFNSQNHYFDSDPLDNYADLARKTKVVGQSVTCFGCRAGLLPKSYSYPKASLHPQQS